MKNGVAVVTGASRGAGQGIARALGAAGYTVYVTGRSQTADASPLGGTIHESAAEVTAAGGRSALRTPAITPTTRRCCARPVRDR